MVKSGKIITQQYHTSSSGPEQRVKWKPFIICGDNKQKNTFEIGNVYALNKI